MQNGVELAYRRDLGMSPGRWSGYWRSQLSRIYPPIYVLFVGLESSGKTSLLNLIVQQSTLVSSSTVAHQSRDPDRQPDGDHVSIEERPCQQSSTSATVGFDTTRFNANRRCFIVFDMSGQVRLRLAGLHMPLAEMYLTCMYECFRPIGAVKISGITSNSGPRHDHLFGLEASENKLIKTTLAHLLRRFFGSPHHGGQPLIVTPLVEMYLT